MTRRVTISILCLMLISVMCLSLMGCGTTTFESITGIDDFNDITKIVIVNNSYIVDGQVAGSPMREYILKEEILAIFNIMSRATYRHENVDNSRVSKYVLRIFVKGEQGYIEYSWDKSFEKKDDYTGKLKEGEYSMDEADKVMAKLEEIYYND